jgi:hypothetical protein
VDPGARDCQIHSVNPLDLDQYSGPAAKEFDMVVIESRTLAREVHLEKALDEDDKPLDASHEGD